MGPLLSPSSWSFSSVPKLLQIFRESADFEKLAHRIREFRKETLGVFTPDFAGGEIDLDLIAFLDCIVEFRALHNSQAGVDGIAVERTREGTGNDSFDAQPHDCGHGLFAGAAAAKIAAGNQNIEVVELFGEAVSEDLKSMLGQFLGFYIDKVAPWNDDVGIDVVSELLDLAVDLLFHNFRRLSA